MKEEGKEGRTEDGKGNWKGERERVDGGRGGRVERKDKKREEKRLSHSLSFAPRIRKREERRGRSRKEAKGGRVDNRCEREIGKKIGRNKQGKWKIAGNSMEKKRETNAKETIQINNKA